MELDDMFEHKAQAIHAVTWSPILIGTLAAIIAGYISVKWTLWLIRTSRMRFFAIYAWAIAAFILSDQLFFHHWFPPLLH